MTRNWLEIHFIPLIKHYVSLEIGSHPAIFIDTQIEYGTDWPITLGHAISKSKTIIPLWTKTYMESKWCACEIQHMLNREREFGFRTNENPGGLVFPTIYHDGETMPVHLSTIQKIEIQDCANPKMSVDSAKAEILAEKLSPLGKAIAKAIGSAPEWQDNWQIEAVNEFKAQLDNNHQAFQSSPPKFQNQ